MQDIELYRGRKPIRVFTDQVTTVEVRQNLGNLVVKLENAVKYLEAAQFTHNECKRIWGKSWMEDKSQELCTENIAAQGTQWHRSVDERNQPANGPLPKWTLTPQNARRSGIQLDHKDIEALMRETPQSPSPPTTPPQATARRAPAETTYKIRQK